MTLDELNSLRFNTPIMSTIDNSLWYYDSLIPPNGVRIFKNLVVDYVEFGYRRGGRSGFINRLGDSPWIKEDELVISERMMLNDFELIYKIVKSDIKFVKKDKNLTTSFSIVTPNFHMI
jgi:hypothetical protein